MLRMAADIEQMVFFHEHGLDIQLTPSDIRRIQADHADILHRDVQRLQHAEMIRDHLCLAFARETAAISKIHQKSALSADHQRDLHPHALRREAGIDQCGRILQRLHRQRGIIPGMPFEACLQIKIDLAQLAHGERRMQKRERLISAVSKNKNFREKLFEKNSLQVRNRVLYCSR